VGDLAHALHVTTDELLGVKPLRATPNPQVARLMKRLERLAELPPAEQRAVLKVVEGFLDANDLQRRAPSSRAKRKAS